MKEPLPALKEETIHEVEGMTKWLEDTAAESKERRKCSGTPQTSRDVVGKPG